MIRLLEVSRDVLAKQRVFAAAMQRLLDQRDHLATEAVHRAWDLLEDLRRQVSTELLTAGGFDLYYLPRLKAAITKLGQEFAARYYADLAHRIDASWTLGSESIDESLRGVEVRLGTMSLDRTTLEIVQGYTADLITRLTAETITAINGQIVRGVLGGQSVFDTMKAITGLLGSADAVQQKGNLKFVAQGVAYRAETITRTEMMRAYNLANFARAQDASDVLPYHQWRTARDRRVRASHAALEGKIVKVGQEFAPGLRFPHDPNGIARETISCRCRAFAIYQPPTETAQALIVPTSVERIEPVLHHPPVG